MAKASLFLRLIDGGNKPVEGECLDANHAGEIDVSSWSWSVSDPANRAKEEGAEPATSGAGADAGARRSGGTPSASSRSRPAAAGGADAKVQPDLFTFSKKLDKSSVRMLKAIDTGEVFSKATIVLEEEFKEASDTAFHLAINLTDILFVKFDMSIDGSSGVEFRENWSVTYGTIKFTYRLRAETAEERDDVKRYGKSMRGHVDVSFSRPKGSAATPSRTSPLTKAELAAQEQKRQDEIVRRLAQQQSHGRSGR